LVVCQSGVLVIDARRYSGRPRPRLRVQGGLLTPRTETLVVGRRDGTKLVDGALKQAALVAAALKTGTPAQTPVRPMLCFLDADWPLVGGSFVTRGVEVLWPRKVIAHARQPGALSVDDITNVARTLAMRFPRA